TLLIVSTLTVMSGATIAPSLPAIENHFASVSSVEYLVKLVLTIPALFIVIGAPIAGIITDKMGRKPLLIVSTLLYGFAGSSGLVLNNLFSLLIGRAFLGIAVAGLMTSVTTLIADYYTGQRRANFMGLQAGFMGLGGVIFLSLGGFLADLNWRMPFAIYLFAWLILPLIVFFLYEPQPNLVLIKDSQTENNSRLPVKLLCVIYSLAMLDMLVFYLIPVQLPFYLRSLINATATQSGLAIAFATLFSSIASLGYGRLKVRFSFVSITVLAFLLVSSGYVTIGLARSYPLVLLGLLISGLGFGLLMPNLSVWLTTKIPDALRGRALGGLTTAFFLGQFLSPIVSQPISQHTGLGMTYIVEGGILLVLAIALLTRKRQLTTIS
ncbi:MAG: MFS transporter, partial [Oscillatoria sp. PMC 1068.18]|nr:MFS transporter [Oscillatoria sp. PMC 1068.18]